MHRSKKRWFSDFDSLTIVSTSEWLERKLNRSFLKSTPRRLITNGIDTSIFRLYEVDENPMKDYDNKFIVLSVIAKLDDSNKGFHIIQRLAEEAQGSDLLFVVIGSKGKITNLPSNILNIPRTENQIELAKFYAFSDLYLMVSEFETYPTVTLEASAASLPILAFDAGGTKETIIGVHGKVLPYDSPDTLSEIYNLKTSIQSKNYKKVRNPQLDIIDRSKMIDSYMSVYQGASL
jgi:glycosyltransferase involved in cell wall biosynthesis